MLLNSDIVVLSFANKVGKFNLESSFVLCTEYQGRYNIFQIKINGRLFRKRKKKHQPTRSFKELEATNALI